MPGYKVIEDVREVLGDEFLTQLGEALAQLREAISLSTPDDTPPEQHPIIKRVTHLRCGTTFTAPFTIEVMNEVDSACPVCCEIGVPGFPPAEAYGELVWEHRDGTLWLTESEEDGTMLTHQPIRTHVQVYKSWVNGPEWWIVPRPNTGDIDGSDNLIAGFDTYQQAIDAVNSGEMPAMFAELCTDKDGIAWRDRHDPIYQTTSSGRTF